MIAPGSELSRRLAALICPALPAGGVPEDFWQVPWGGFLFDSRRDRDLAAWIRASGRDLLVCADLERGAGQHLPDSETVPHAWVFGVHDDLEATRLFGEWTAREALLAGVNWVLAPVADVQTHPSNPIIQTRAFSDDPVRTARHVVAFIEGVQAAGALACAKHFPGHGDTGFDTHSTGGEVDVSEGVWLDREAIPFGAAIRAGVDTVMLAHLAIPALDPSGQPASLSAPVIARLRAMGFDGLVVTDALDMAAIAGAIDPMEASIQAICSGVDVLLMPPDPLRTLQALEVAVLSGRLSEARVHEALERQHRVRRRIPAQRPASPTSGEREDFRQRLGEVARGSLRVRGTLPEDLTWNRLAPLIIDSDPDIRDTGVAALARRLEGRVGEPVPVLDRDGLPAARAWADQLSGRVPVLFHLSAVRAWKGDPALPGTWQTWCETLPPGRGIVSFTRESWILQDETQAWMLQAWADHEACHEAALAWLESRYWKTLPSILT